MAFVTRKEYCELKGWSRQYVGKLVKSQRLVLNAAGQIDVDASEQLLAMTSDPSKVGVAARHERSRPKRVDQPPLEIVIADYIDAPSDQAPDFQRSRALREHYLSLQEKNNFLKSQGTLVERKSVEDAAYNAGRLLRDLLLGIAPQLAPELASMSDPWKIEKRLTAAFRQTLDDAERLSEADLQHAITPS
ncbi:terminase small subunit [Pseudomonas sp. RGM 3321]|uniref:terminase small subunit n=1 Tax=Pseudomonas sp. RGM 3321 TaxID=2930089 RepID=UPI001FCC9F03|nr:terminase small subunit [Pseudomonas sp. RGM 3321]MCJ2373729.1 terminase small subunit [Pseudomonas sp. RGM 3321]